jgi:hypothetical protein
MGIGLCLGRVLSKGNEVLLREARWLDETDLEGLGEEKLEWIRDFVAWSKR